MDHAIKGILEHEEEVVGSSLETQKILVKKNGMLKEVPALHKVWIEYRCFMFYCPPPTPNDDGSYPIGTKSEWLERMDAMHEDLEWLLTLKHYRFWSQFVFDESVLHFVSSYLQAAPLAHNTSSPEDEEIRKSLERTHYLVFMVYYRLSINKESEINFINPQAYGEILYDNFLFDIPTIMDLCVLYGNENRAVVTKMVNNVLSSNSKYEQDIRKMTSSVLKTFESVQEELKCDIRDNNEPMKLADGWTEKKEISLDKLKDLLMYVLDIAVTLSSFLDICDSACKILHQESFDLRIAKFYENIFPTIYKHLENVRKGGTDQADFNKMKYKVDCARVDLVKSFRLILSSCVISLVENRDAQSESKCKKHIEEYMNVIGDCISEKIFIFDYNSKYPVDMDFDMMSQMCSSLDVMKCDFILEAIASCYDTPPRSSKNQPLTNHTGQNAAATEPSGSPVLCEPKKITEPCELSAVEKVSLISEVRDLFPHLGDGFVEECLKHYNFNSETVINSLLEDTLPAELRDLDRNMQRRIEPKEEEPVNSIVLERLNIFDNDEFDIMTQDNIDTSRVHKGKRKFKHKTMQSLLDDNAELGGLREMYSKYGSIDTEGSMYDVMYDDDFDDSFELLDVRVNEPDEPEEKLDNVRSRRDEEVYEESDEEEEEKKKAGSFEAFCQNPAELREKAEQRRQLKHEQFQHRKKQLTANKDVAGKPKGQGQEKNVVVNRQRKEAHKSSRGNHNRRVGSQRKRAQGMIPS